MRVVARGAPLSTDEDAPEPEITKRIQAVFDTYDDDGSGDIQGHTWCTAKPCTFHWVHC